MTAGPRDRRDIVRVADLQPSPPPASTPTPPSPRPARSRRRWLSVLGWILGLLITVVLIVMLGKSIPAAPRPTLGPPSVSSSNSR